MVTSTKLPLLPLNADSHESVLHVFHFVLVRMLYKWNHRPFTFNTIIGILGLKCAIFIYFCLFVSSVFHFSMFLSFLWVTWQILEFYFYLSIAFFDVFLCIDFIVVAISITLYMYNLSQTTDVDILPVWIKCRNITSF